MRRDVVLVQHGVAFTACLEKMLMLEIAKFYLALLPRLQRLVDVIAKRIPTWLDS